jgi:putative transposase
VIRLMQEQELKARVRRRYKCTTMSDHAQPVAANLLARRFGADVPNQRWVGDTTELRIGDSGRLFLRRSWTCSRDSSSAGRCRR